MTRKHFQAIADVLRATKPDIGIMYVQWQECVDGMADMCRKENPRFDEVRFREACGDFP